MTSEHHFPIRVYYEDTDAAGIVYYANYLRFAERARTEALRTTGINQSELLKEHKLGFVVRHCEIDFLRGAKLDDLLTIKTQVHDISNASIVLKQNICREHETLVTLSVTLALVGENMRPARIPAFVKAAMHAIGAQQPGTKQ